MGLCFLIPSDFFSSKKEFFPQHPAFGKNSFSFNPGINVLNKNKQRQTAAKIIPIGYAIVVESLNPSSAYKI